jgi:hypothetical protein
MLVEPSFPTGRGFDVAIIYICMHRRERRHNDLSTSPWQAEAILDGGRKAALIHEDHQPGWIGRWQKDRPASEQTRHAVGADWPTFFFAADLACGGVESAG